MHCVLCWDKNGRRFGLGTDGVDNRQLNLLNFFCVVMILFQIVANQKNEIELGKSKIYIEILVIHSLNEIINKI